jgi:hypothetical protein
MSSSTQQRVDAFIESHELDPDMSNDLQELIIGCISDMFKHLFPVPFDIPEQKEKKAKKVLKAEKVDDPSTVESIEELNNCTTGVLNQYCREKSLKIGGNKKELKDRVWRHLQGESSDEDKSSRGKPKKEKKVSEKHICLGFKLDGSPCQISGTEEKDGCFFCYKHISDADKWIEAHQKKPKSKASGSKSKKEESDDEHDEDDEPPPPPPPSKKGKAKKPEPKEELSEEE